MRLVSLLLVLLTACAVGDAETPRPRVEAHACVASFGAVLEGWEALIGPVPEACAHLDEVYTVTLQHGDMPCTSSGPGRVIGCAMPDDHIYIRAGLGETKSVDVSVHEWVHALSLCVTGDEDSEHANRLAWGEHPHGRDIELEPGDVKAYGLLVSALGPCL